MACELRGSRGHVARRRYASSMQLVFGGRCRTGSEPGSALRRDGYGPPSLTGGAGAQPASSRLPAHRWRRLSRRQGGAKLQQVSSTNPAAAPAPLPAWAAAASAGWVLARRRRSAGAGVACCGSCSDLRKEPPCAWPARPRQPAAPHRPVRRPTHPQPTARHRQQCGSPLRGAGPVVSAAGRRAGTARTGRGRGRWVARPGRCLAVCAIAAFVGGRGSRRGAGRTPRAGAAAQAASGSRSWCRRRGCTARPWRPTHGRWRGRRRATRRTAPAALRSAGPGPGRARSPLDQCIEHKFEIESRTLRSPTVRSEPGWAALGPQLGGTWGTAKDSRRQQT